MERCHSSEAVMGRPLTERDGHSSGPKASSLLLNVGEKIISRSPSPSSDMGGIDIEQPFQGVVTVKVQPMERLPSGGVPTTTSLDEAEVEEQTRRVEEMEVDDAPASIWGMPSWGREGERKEVRKGVRLVGVEEVSFVGINDLELTLSCRD